MPLAKGDLAQIVAPVITGEVKDIKFDPDTGEKRILLEWQGDSGATNERWFKEDELEAAV